MVIDFTERMQGAPVDSQRGDHGHLGGGEFPGEGVLLLDLGRAPAAGAVELQHDGRVRVGQRRTGLQMGQVDAVLVGVERHQPTVANQAGAGQRVQHEVGGEVLERVGGCGHAGIVVGPARWAPGHRCVWPDERRPGRHRKPWVPTPDCHAHGSAFGLDQ